MTNDEKRS